MFVCKRCGMKDESIGYGNIAYGHCDECSEEMAEGIALGLYGIEEVA